MSIDAELHKVMANLETLSKPPIQAPEQKVLRPEGALVPAETHEKDQTKFTPNGWNKLETHKQRDAQPQVDQELYIPDDPSRQDIYRDHLDSLSSYGIENGEFTDGKTQSTQTKKTHPVAQTFFAAMAPLTGGQIDTNMTPSMLANNETANPPARVQQDTRPSTVYNWQEPVSSPSGSIPDLSTIQSRDIIGGTQKIKDTQVQKMNITNTEVDPKIQAMAAEYDGPTKDEQGKSIPEVYRIERSGAIYMYQDWKSRDEAVLYGTLPKGKERSWMYGDPKTFVAKMEKWENEERLVVYTDKARQEEVFVNNDVQVKNGLLTVELMTGKRRVGMNSYETRYAAEILVAGEPGSKAPTYATLAKVATLEGDKNKATDKTGQKVTQYIDEKGNISDAKQMGVPQEYIDKAQYSYYHAGMGHNLPKQFHDLYKMTGPIIEKGTEKVGQIYIPEIHTGWPITEAYWTKIKKTVNGKQEDRFVMLQGAERRVFTWDPLNEAQWQVENGNIGTQYFDWLYKHAGKPADTKIETPTAVPPTPGRTESPTAVVATATPRGENQTVVTEYNLGGLKLKVERDKPEVNPSDPTLVVINEAELATFLRAFNPHNKSEFKVNIVKGSTYKSNDVTENGYKVGEDGTSTSLEDVVIQGVFRNTNNELLIQITPATEALIKRIRSEGTEDDKFRVENLFRRAISRFLASNEKTPISRDQYSSTTNATEEMKALAKKQQTRLELP
ncbi:MAG TPA: hypothetical protein VK338_05520 [Candidatus Nitrosocosmicus sp.]|nr:hypothetical protein [Candidatus Nitrosocosmicus sp.]